MARQSQDMGHTARNLNDLCREAGEGDHCGPCDDRHLDLYIITILLTRLRAGVKIKGTTCASFFASLRIDNGEFLVEGE